jgi:hypothetical protein
VHELEAPELGVAVLREALLRAGQLDDLLEADLLARPAERLGEGPPHRDHERGAHDRRAFVRSERPVGIEVEQPPPQRGGRRPHDRLEATGGDPRLGVAARDDLALDEGLAVLIVELADQRREQLLLLRREGEADAQGPLRGALVLGLAGLGGVVAAAGRDHGDDRHRHRGEDRYEELAALHWRMIGAAALA